jgi:hypothetical protein
VWRGVQGIEGQGSVRGGGKVRLLFLAAPIMKLISSEGILGMTPKQALVMIKDIAMKPTRHRRLILPETFRTQQLMVPTTFTKTEVRAGCEVLVTRGTISWHG